MLCSARVASAASSGGAPRRLAGSRRALGSVYLRRVPRLDQTPRMALPHLFRVILPVSAIEAAASFYARLLAMPGTRVSSGRHYFDCGGTILACYDALADGDPGPVGPNPQHVYFSVDDLDAAHTRAEQAGLGELTGIEVRPWGERSLQRCATCLRTRSALSTRKRSSLASTPRRARLTPPDQTRPPFCWPL